MADLPSDEALAKKRFLAIALVRILGVTMILLGLAVANDALEWPAWSAYLLIAFGMFDTFVFPIVLSRRWSGNRKP